MFVELANAIEFEALYRRYCATRVNYLGFPPRDWFARKMLGIVS